VDGLSDHYESAKKQKNMDKVYETCWAARQVHPLLQWVVRRNAARHQEKAVGQEVKKRKIIPVRATREGASKRGEREKLTNSQDPSRT